MNPERWRQIDELFDASARIPLAERDAWLREACKGDQELQAEVEYLLQQETLADETGFLKQPELANPQLEATAEWPLKAPPGPSAALVPQLEVEDLFCEGVDGFSPKAAIASGGISRLADESQSVVQARLRELPLIYVLIFGMMLFLRPIVLGVSPASTLVPFAIVATGLLGISILLSVRRFSLARLRMIELIMIIALASLLVIYESRTLIDRSEEAERMFMQLIMKNIVLLTSMLILIGGIYVPKSWQRAAAISSVLAILPLGTLFGVYLRYPTVVQWVGEPRIDGLLPVVVFGLDAVFLYTLAAISSFGAHTISRLRLQVVEARQFGQYRLGKLIGTGGMGDVYLAEHQLLKRSCAIKLIRPSVVLRAGSLELFEREVRINATLSHPNTVEIFDYGRTEDGTYYYVMEYLPGMSLAELVDRHGPLPPERAVYLLRQVALALQEAHQAGLIHRDIKPSNIFAARRGGMDDVAKLLDFGLALPSALAATASLSGENGQILGTPLYMSPEQATGTQSLDRRSDIYSLGAVAYFLLTGRPPFEARTAIEAIISHVRDIVPAPSSIREGIPDDLEDVVLRCLAKDPEERFPDSESLEIALGNCGCATAWDKHRAAQWWRDVNENDQRTLVASKVEV